MSFLTAFLLACIGIIVVAAGNILAHALVTWDTRRKFDARAAEFERRAHEEANRMMAHIDEIDEKHREALRKGAN